MKLDHVTDRILDVIFTWIPRIITGVLLQRQIETQLFHSPLSLS